MKNLVWVLVVIVGITVLALAVQQNQLDHVRRQLAETLTDTLQTPAPPETVTVYKDSVAVFPDTITGGIILEDHLDTPYFDLGTRVFTRPPRFEYRYTMKPVEISIRINKKVHCQVTPSIPATILVKRLPPPSRGARLSLTMGAGFVAQNPVAIVGFKVKTVGLAAIAAPKSIGVVLTYDLKIF